MYVLLLDNYGGLTDTLYRYLSELGATVNVVPNDEIEVDEVREHAPERIVISPGPGTPAEAGISLPLIRELRIEIPILGIGLGHEAIGVAYGGRLIRVPDQSWQAIADDTWAVGSSVDYHRRSRPCASTRWP